jgi:acetyltransferase-like isoleucine patch superfamily enzyme
MSTVIAQEIFGDLSSIKVEATLEAPCSVGRGSLIGRISLGAFSFLGTDGEFHSMAMGRFCSIGPRVVVAPGEHPTDWVSTHPVFYGGGAPGVDRSESFREWRPGLALPVRHMPALIGNDVWIGHGAYIASGVVIGDGAIIGARAVVTRDVEPYAIVAGSPARELRKRFDPDVIARMPKWWNYDLRGTGLPFNEPERFIEAFDALIGAGKLKPFAPAIQRLVAAEGR